SIVLIKEDRPEAQIVDGQQRLATLTILLLAAVRAQVPRDFAAAITRVLYEPANPLVGSSARYRYQPKERDAPFFQTYIQQEDGLHPLRALNPADLSDIDTPLGLTPHGCSLQHSGWTHRSTKGLPGPYNIQRRMVLSVGDESAEGTGVGANGAALL